MITIYRTESCAYCHQVIKLCEDRNADYQVVSLDDDLDLWQKLRDKTGMTTVPITTDGEVYIAGWQPRELVRMINEAE